MRWMKQAVIGMAVGLALLGAGTVGVVRPVFAAQDVVQSRTYTDSRWATSILASGHKQVTLPYQAQYKVSWPAVRRYFFSDLNALRRLNGQPTPVAADAIGNRVASRRAMALTGMSLEHDPANTYGENLAFLPDAGSDQETAYLLLMAWFDETDNVVGAGQSGHFGHRANLLATTGHMGLAWNQHTGHVTFEAESVTNWASYDRIYDQQVGTRQVGLPQVTFSYVR